MLQKSNAIPESGGYVFVSYSHRDARRVNQEISFLEEAGISVWYDHAIRPGHRWRVELAHAIEGCSAFVLFVSESSVASQNCEQELAYAAEHGRPLLQVQLDQTELPTEFRFTLAAQQAILAWDLPKREYRQRLLDSLRASVLETAAPRPEQSHHAAPHRRWSVAVGAACFLVLVSVGYIVTQNISLPGFEKPVVRPYETSDRSIAVLRFISIGEDTALGDGLGEHLLHLLMGLREISVPSRTSSWMAGNAGLGPQEVARNLGVRYVLEGSVQKVEDKLRVTAQLIDGFTGLHVWSQSYDEQLTAASFFEIQDDIARQLVRSLEVTLSSASVDRLSAGQTQNDQALDAYLQGLAFRRGPTTSENLEAATQAFEASLSQDPTFAEAHAALCETRLAAYAVLRNDAQFVLAKNNCLAAQRIDPLQASVLVALGTLYRHEGRYADAEVEIDRALAMQPRNTAVLEEKGRLLRAMGRYPAARSVFEEAIRTEPGNWSVYKSMGNFLVRTGRYEEAIGLYRQALRLDADNEVVRNNLATTLHMAGEFGPAGELWREISERTPSFLAYMNLANACFYNGEFTQAVHWYDRAISISTTDFRAFGGRAASLEYARGQDAALADYGRAAELARVVAERNRHDPQALSRLSFYQAKLGEVALAEAGLRRLEAMQGVDPDSRFMMALAYITLGDLDTAQRVLDEAIAAGFSVALVAADPLVARVISQLELEQV